MAEAAQPPSSRRMRLPRPSAVLGLAPRPPASTHGPISEEWLGLRHQQEASSARLSPSAEPAAGVRPSHLEGSFVYSFGVVGVKFPSLSVEKEFFQAYEPQAGSGAAPFDLGDEAALLRLNEELADFGQALFDVLKQADNVYIAREMCWLLRSVRGRELFLIEPTSDEQLALLVAALQPAAGKSAPRIYIGREAGALANPFCSRFGLPATTMTTVAVAPVNGLAVPGSDPAKLAELVAAIQALAENEGTGGGDRALNWLLANDVDVYATSYDLAHNTSGRANQLFDLVRVRAQPVFGAGPRERVNVVFDYQGQSSGATQSRVSCVDVTGEFPYQVSKLGAFVARG